MSNGTQAAPAGTARVLRHGFVCESLDSESAGKATQFQVPARDVGQLNAKAKAQVPAASAGGRVSACKRLKAPRRPCHPRVPGGGRQRGLPCRSPGPLAPSLPHPTPSSPDGGGTRPAPHPPPTPSRVPASKKPRAGWGRGNPRRPPRGRVEWGGRLGLRGRPRGRLGAGLRGWLMGWLRGALRGRLRRAAAKRLGGRRLAPPGRGSP